MVCLWKFKVVQAALLFLGSLGFFASYFSPNWVLAWVLETNCTGVTSGWSSSLKDGKWSSAPADSFISFAVLLYWELMLSLFLVRWFTLEWFVFFLGRRTPGDALGSSLKRWSPPPLIQGTDELCCVSLSMYVRLEEEHESLWVRSISSIEMRWSGLF